MSTAAERLSESRPNDDELQFPLSEWVLYLMHNDLSATYQDHPAATTLAQH